MIFQHRFIHCDAHPGNILVRKAANDFGHQIVLLDHGLYRSVGPETITNFSGLWTSLFVQEKKKVLEYAEKLNIHNHFEYLPLIFLQRSRNSSKKIGEPITQEERQ
jgi:aarF domain-containing kinase